MVPSNILSKAEYKRLKPIFKKVISQEISKLITNGNFTSVSIRDAIQQQDLEEKVQNLITKGLKPSTALLPFVPKRLTQSKIMKMLYE